MFRFKYIVLVKIKSSREKRIFNYILKPDLYNTDGYHLFIYR